jgi:uncharacterized protein YjbI with pentapeptide repeats
MRTRAWAPLLALCLAVVMSCGGGRGGGTGAQPTFAVASITTAHDVLQLPLLQSGAALYADVSIALEDNGTFRVLSWRDVESSSPASIDATLDPPVPLAELARYPQPVRMAVRRFHIDNGVYGSAQVEFNAGRWRYVSQPVASNTLTALDLRANPGLVANDDTLAVMQSAPGKTEEFPLRLESRNYRFCMEPQDDGADAMTISDPDGNPVAALRAGGPCATFVAVQGMYTVRNTFGGTSVARTVFMQRVPRAAPPAAGPTVLPQSDPSESWAILASMVDTRQREIPGTAGFLGAGPGLALYPGAGCIGFISGVFQPTSLVPVVETIDEARPRRDRALFDGFNFFRTIRDAAGSVVQLGAPFDCPAADRVVLEEFSRLAGRVFVVDPVGEPLVPFEANPVKITNLSASANTFSLRSTFSAAASDDALGPFVVLKGSEFPVGDVDLAGGTNVILYAQLPERSRVATAQYRVALRYRPNGIPGNAVPAQGQVALFNTPDCSGAAMVVDQYDLPGLMEGRLGAFRGSLKLGLFTTATVFSQMFQNGESQVLATSGCIVAGWGAAQWRAASLAIKVETIDMVLSTNRCERCNLAGMDLSERNLQNAKFAGTNLNGATLSRANLAGADLRQAFLQGAQLPNANLDAANLCGANLNAAPSSAGTSNVAANLAGAFLRNANLSKSNIAGVNFDHANFYSSNNATCAVTTCDSYARPVCASAAGATLEGAQFSSAYMAGVDMTNTHGSGAVFSGAVLTGARFNNATLTPLGGTPVNFSGAFIQGADFTAADLTNATFTNAYGAESGDCMHFELGEQHTSFPGFAVPVTPDSSQCKSAPAQKTCVKFSFSQATILPSSVKLPTPAVPIADALPRNSGCRVAPLCGGPFPPDRVNTCW